MKMWYEYKRDNAQLDSRSRGLRQKRVTLQPATMSNIISCERPQYDKNKSSTRLKNQLSNWY